MTSGSAASQPDPGEPLIRSRPWQEPESAFLALSGRPDLVWLDSAALVGPRCRYSYLCVEPFSILEERDGVLRHDGIVLAEDPFDVLARLLARWRQAVRPGPVPFLGGAVGLLGYPLAHHLERLPRRHRDDPGMPSLWLGFFDLVLAFDRLERRCWLISRGRPGHPATDRADRAGWLEALLHHPPAVPGPLPALRWAPDLDPVAYAAMVARGLDYIRAGDIFQANLTMRHVATRPPGLDPVAVHLALRRDNPAPFAAFIGWTGGRAVSSASPERFIRLETDGRVETRPIKGTRRRVPDPALDAGEAAALAASPKDRAENLMIVDLMRNDLSRIAVPGSVAVPSLFAIESVATLHHLVSVVTARLRPEVGVVGLLRASFPGGSVTGAPKIRAMQIIDELEAAARGPYCGCIAWIGFDGGMDSSIVIRTLLMTGGDVVAQAGGGIVADSSPEGEHAEMLAKVMPLLSLFPVAGGPG